MTIYISIVSHGHEEILKKNNHLIEIAKKHQVIIKNNTKEKKGALASTYQNSNVIIIDQEYNLGFGANNNYIYNYAKKNLNMKDDDYFFIVNPDIFIELDKLDKVASLMEKNNLSLSTILLYKEHEYITRDNSIRKFPTFLDFLSSFITRKKEKIIINNKNEYSYADWAAGSFLAFTNNLYHKLNGFDESYFMYCEDIDICFRANINGHKLAYIPQIKAVHLAKRKNRSIFSKHFFWHLRSIFIYLNKSRKHKRQSQCLKYFR